MKNFKIIILLITGLLLGSRLFSQCLPEVKTDTVKIISINYVDNEYEKEPQVYYYAYHNKHLYNITNYLINGKNDCLPASFRSCDVLYISDNKIIKKILKSKPKKLEASDKNKFKKFIGWNCADVYTSFFLFPCNTDGFRVPLEKFLDHNFSISFTNISSKELKESGLPSDLFEYVKQQ